MLGQITAVRLLLDQWPRNGPPEPPDLSAITERLDRLEVGWSKWAAVAEANLLKADALFKNARNAEERTRSKAAKLDEDSAGSVESEEFAKAYERWLQDDGDAEGNGVHVRRLAARAVREDVEVSGKALAIRAKFS